MTRRQKLKTPKKTGHPYIDNALRNFWREQQPTLTFPTHASWSFIHMGLPRKRKKYMKKISMRMNIINHITNFAKESN